MDAATGTPVDIIVSPVGSVLTLRCDFLQDFPVGEIVYGWTVTKKCVDSAQQFTPDFKRDVTVRGHGTIRVTVRDENGFSLQTQTVKVSPA